MIPYFRNHQKGNHLRNCNCTCGFLFPIIIFALLLISHQIETTEARTTSTNTTINQRTDQNLFPRIYQVRFPTSQQHHNATSTMKRFISQVDLVHKQEIKDKTVSNRFDNKQLFHRHTKISFLVHSQHELDHLSAMLQVTMTQQDIHEGLSSDYYSIQLDTKATSELWSSTSTDNTKKHHTGSNQQLLRQRRQEEDTTYSTIRNYPCFRDFEGTIQSMRDIVQEAETIPNLSVTMTDIGDSFLKTQDSSQGYDIWVLNITGTGFITNNNNNQKCILFVMSGLHPREMAPPELVLLWIEQTLVAQYGTNADITSILDHTEIHVVLQSNPDGRVADETRQRLRRKNMNDQSGGGSTSGSSLCGANGYGVDLNRNFPFMWGRESGSSSNPCSPVYRGEYPASEPEVQAIVNYVTQIFPQEQQKQNPENMINIPLSQNTKGMFLDIHSYGEVLYYPWAFEEIPSPNDSDVVVLATKLANFNNHQLSGHGSDDFYDASGVSDDYAYGTVGVPAMTFELGNAFYQSCQYFDVNVARQNMDALTFAAKLSWEPFKLSKGPDIGFVDLLPSNRPISSEDTHLSITVHINDNMIVNGDDNTLFTAWVFIDQHPHDIVVDDYEETGATPKGAYLMDTQHQDTDGLENMILLAEVSLDVSDLAQLVKEPVAGRHVLYIQAVGQNGYKGPVTAVYFDMEDIQLSPPTSQPTTGQPKLNGYTESHTDRPITGCTRSTDCTPGSLCYNGVCTPQANIPVGATGDGSSDACPKLNDGLCATDINCNCADYDGEYTQKYVRSTSGIPCWACYEPVQDYEECTSSIFCVNYAANKQLSSCVCVQGDWDTSLDVKGQRNSFRCVSYQCAPTEGMQDGASCIRHTQCSSGYCNWPNAVDGVIDTKAKVCEDPLLSN